MPDHLSALSLVVQDPLVIEWLWPHSQAPSPEQLLERFCRHCVEHGFGPWTFFERVSGQPVGYAGPHRTEVEGNAEVELIYAVASSRWGEGLATEMARAAVAHTDIAGVVCFTLSTNSRSRRVMEKAGFRYERDFERAGLPHVLFRLPKAR